MSYNVLLMIGCYCCHSCPAWGEDKAMDSESPALENESSTLFYSPALTPACSREACGRTTKQSSYGFTIKLQLGKIYFPMVTLIMVR